jgi:xanthine dehydrogenase molybdopterin-binding subunit B
MASGPVSAERLADHFISYLFDQYKGSRHVRRVASWIGFIVKAAEKLGGSTLRQNRERQIMFTYKRRQFKAKYNHEVGARGGIQIVEVLPGRGSPEGDTVIQIKNLSEAENCYLTLKARLDSFTT